MANGTRPRTAADVAQLESDNEYLANENERLQRELAIVTADRSRLQIENALLDGKARESLISATRMETIVRQVSSGLVAALDAVTQERKVARNVRRQEQEEVLNEETGSPPAFLRQQAAPVVPAAMAVRTESDQDRQDRLRGAAERIMPIPPAAKPGRIDHTLADRDDRLPRNAMPQDLDELAGKTNQH